MFFVFKIRVILVQSLQKNFLSTEIFHNMNFDLFLIKLSYIFICFLINVSNLLKFGFIHDKKVIKQEVLVFKLILIFDQAL
jgi:hypothetical protein